MRELIRTCVRPKLGSVSRLPLPPSSTGMEASRKGSHILHVDMDAFFASVEVRRRPWLRGKPVVVGGTGPRGVVASASYEARAYGIVSGMPTARARRLCPWAYFLPPDFLSYQEESAALREILESFTPLVEMASLDEAYLDVSGAGSLFGSPEEVARKIRERVKGERGLSCSVGAAPNKLVAKVASGLAKPDGLVVVEPERVTEFLAPLPVSRLPGVGAKTRETLEALGIRTLGELAGVRLEALEPFFGPSQARWLLAASRGEDASAVLPNPPPKQISAEETFPRDLDDDQEVRREILRLAQRVARRLREEGLAASTVTLKVRTDTFRTFTRSLSLPAPTDLGWEIADLASSLFRRSEVGARVRLLGISLSRLGPGSLPDLEGRREKRRRAEQVMDELQRRFGRGAPTIASFLTASPSEGRGR